MLTRCYALATVTVSFHLGWAFDLSEDLVSLSLRAAQLSKAVYQDNPGVSRATIFTEEPDRALVVNEGNVCWAVFRGTTMNVEDWSQNLDMIPKDACSPLNECCHTHGGFRDAYFLPEFRPDLESAVRDCMSTCPDCEVVLTGHSQGGAIATIAAIAMDDLKPTIITFGQAATILWSCLPIDVDKYFRYVNTIFEGSGELFYDPVPFVNMFVDKLGHLILLGDDITNVASFENEIGPSVLQQDWNFDAHAIDNYILRLDDMFATGSFPIRADGWDIGFGCDNDSECMTPLQCVQNQCSLTTGR